MTITNDKEMHAIAFLEKKPLHMLALESSLLCNLTSYPHLLLLCEKRGLSTNHNTLRNTLKSLTKPTKAFAPLLREILMRIQGRSGSATSVYTLTDFGRSVMNCKGFRTPEAQDVASLAHRYIQLEVYTHASKSSAEIEVEKVIPYENGHRNIRVDVLAAFTKNLDLPGYVEKEEYFFEAEQELLPSNAKRAVEKVRNWQDYGLPGEYPDIVIVFNVPKKRLDRTISLWRTALQTLNEEPTFQIRYILLSNLLELPLRDALREYGVHLLPEMKEQKEESEEWQLSPFVRQLRVYQPSEDTLETFEIALDDWRVARLPAQRLESFFALMRCIHQASDLRESSETFQYNLLPVESLWLLHQYLTLLENKPLYEELRMAIHWMQSRSNLGVTMLKEVSSQILWDVFLAYHGFARGGRLQVHYEIADHLDPKKTFGAKVTYHTSNVSGSQLRHPSDIALEWVLNALFTYSDVLDLGRLPWKKKPKGGDV